MATRFNSFVLNSRSSWNSVFYWHWFLLPHPPFKTWLKRNLLISFSKIAGRIWPIENYCVSWCYLQTKCQSPQYKNVVSKIKKSQNIKTDIIFLTSSVNGLCSSEINNQQDFLPASFVIYCTYSFHLSQGLLKSMRSFSFVLVFIHGSFIQSFLLIRLILYWLYFYFFPTVFIPYDLVQCSLELLFNVSSLLIIFYLCPLL